MIRSFTAGDSSGNWTGSFKPHRWSESAASMKTDVSTRLPGVMIPIRCQPVGSSPVSDHRSVCCVFDLRRPRRRGLRARRPPAPSIKTELLSFNLLTRPRATATLNYHGNRAAGRMRSRRQPPFFWVCLKSLLIMVIRRQSF